MGDLSFVGLIQESAFVLIVFGAFLFYAIVRGRHSLINLIMGLYFALLISIEFPYYETILGGAKNAHTEAILLICVFAVFTVISTIVLGRFLHQGDYSDRGFSAVHRKVIYALAATALVLTFSFHTLPVTELIDPGPVQILFASEQSFFYWLFVPIAILFFL